MLAQKVSPSRTALIVVDMQEYFCHPDSALNRFAAELDTAAAREYLARLTTKTIPNIKTLLRVSRDQDCLVMFTEIGSDRADGADLPKYLADFSAQSRNTVGEPCIPPLSDPTSRVLSELAPSGHELVIQKTTSGPLAGTTIDYTLRRHGIDTVVVTGVATDACVLGMCRELADSNFTVHVVDDASATFFGEASHAAALRVLDIGFATVETTDSVLEWLEQDC